LTSFVVIVPTRLDGSTVNWIDDPGADSMNRSGLERCAIGSDSVIRTGFTAKIPLPCGRTLSSA
jgi:hypothetical protein